MNVQVKKLVPLFMVALLTACLFCATPAEAKRRGLKVGSAQWTFFWNMFWLAHWRKWVEIPGWVQPTFQVTGTVLPFGPPPVIPPAAAPFIPPTPAGVTVLTFENASGTDAYLCVSTQTGSIPCATPPSPPSIMQDGCPYQVSQLGIVDLATNQPGSFVQWPSNAPAQGWYLWKNGHTLQVYNNMTNPYTGANNGCLQGLIFSINTWGANCACDWTTAGVSPPAPPPPHQVCNGFPDTDPTSPTYNSNTPKYLVLLPNGSSACEPSLNLPGLQCNQPYGNNPHESADITCNQGSHAIFSLTITPPSGGPYFTYNVGNGSQTATSTFTTQNSWLLVNPSTVKASCDDNCIDPNAPIAGSSRAGVYPYGATQCTVNPDPTAPCIPDPYELNKQFCGAAAGSGCLFDRAPNAGQVFGGTVAYKYIGPATPPASCP